MWRDKNSRSFFFNFFFYLQKRYHSYDQATYLTRVPKITSHFLFLFFPSNRKAKKKKRMFLKSNHINRQIIPNICEMERLKPPPPTPCYHRQISPEYAASLSSKLMSQMKLLYTLRKRERCQLNNLFDDGIVAGIYSSLIPFERLHTVYHRTGACTNAKLSHY